MNQFRIRRNFRANIAESVTTKLEKGLKRHNLSRSDFARLMTKKKLGVYGGWASVYRRICDLFNGRYPSDEFCANIYNVMDQIDKNPTILDKMLRTRSGFKKFTTGQSIASRDSHFSDSTNKGYLYIRKMLRKSVKENS